MTYLVHARLYHRHMQRRLHRLPILALVFPLLCPQHYLGARFRLIVHLHVCMCVCVCVCVCVCMYLCMCVCVCVCVCVCMYVYTHMYVCMYVYTHTHTHTQTNLELPNLQLRLVIYPCHAVRDVDIEECEVHDLLQLCIDHTHPQPRHLQLERIPI